MYRTLLVVLLPSVMACSAPRLPRPAAPPARQATSIRQPDSRYRGYRASVRRIIDAVQRSNQAFAKLEQLCDGIGHRVSGSVELQRAIQWAVTTLRADGHSRVRTEPVMVPKWVRGEESLEMVAPRAQPLVMLGLGGSVGTPVDGITGEVIVVADEAELERIGHGAKGKIVLFNVAMQPYSPDRGTGYGKAVRYRIRGAAMAAKWGAVAVLVRSLTAKSLRTPHTGWMSYEGAERKIPAAAVAIEDAELIVRLVTRGQTVRVRLRMNARNEEMVPSANVLAEIRGRQRPQEIVVIGAHLDSWDVGQGAHDNGAGCVIVMEAATALRRLNLIPRRTIRVVLWTNEERGVHGGKQYARAHAAELRYHMAAIEADTGGFRPTGFSLRVGDSARGTAQKRLRALAALLDPLGAMEVKDGFGGADIAPLGKAGVPLLGLRTDPSRYFDIHHSAADTLDKVDARELSQSVAAMAAMAYLLAEIPEGLVPGLVPDYSR